MCRKKAFLLSSFLCALSTVWAEGPCFIEGISDSDRIYTNPDEVKDSYIGTVQIFNDTNILDASIQNSKYIDVSVENYVLEIATTPEFETYEENEEESTIIVNIALVCEDGNDTLEYRLLVQDENDHDPEFERAHYYYTFYDSLPFLLDFALTDLQPIVARDVDLSYYEVNFAIEENKYFGINYATRSVKSSKDHLAILFNLEEINAPFNETFEITVKDFGNRSSSALVTVEVIELIQPIFTKTLYVARLTEDLKVEVENGPITFVDNVGNVTVNLPPDFSDYFQVEVNQEEEVELTAITDVFNLANENDAIVLPLRSFTDYKTDEALIVIYTFVDEEIDDVEENDDENVVNEDLISIPAEFIDVNTTSSNEDITENFNVTSTSEDPTESNEQIYSTSESINFNTTTEENEDTTISYGDTDLTTEIIEEVISTTTEDTNLSEDDDTDTSDTLEEESITTPFDGDVSTNEETTNYDQTTVTTDRPSTQSIIVELSGFKQWISFSQGFNMFVFGLAGITIAAAILCVKFKLYR